MKSIFRATVLLSGSSLLSILLSLVSTKILAMVLHPSGYGYYGLLQSFVAVGSLIMGMGLPTGLVRLGAGQATKGEDEVLADLRAGAWLMSGVIAVIVSLILTAFRAPLSVWALGSAEHQGAILWMGCALCFTVGLNVQNGLLNTFHRVEALAAYGVVNTFLNGGVSIASVCLWHSQGIVTAVVVGSVASWIASRYFLWRNVPTSPGRTSLRTAIDAAHALLRFGVPFTLSSAVGTGVQLALPMVVLHLVNTEGVAYYKAAAAISVGYLGFLVTTMSQDYYPRLSAVRDQPQAMVLLIHGQYRMVMLLASPIILSTLALVPYLVPLVYSPRFGPTVNILEWQLVGDLFKFSSWTMSFAILAHCTPKVYFATETLGGAAMLGCTWWGVRLFGIAGLGIGFLAAYAIYYMVVRTVLLRKMPARETAQNAHYLLAALAAAIVIRILPSTPLTSWRTTVAILLALGFWIHNFRALWVDYLRDRLTRQKALFAN
jgi:PST family polysaccharide transporter